MRTETRTEKVLTVILFVTALSVGGLVGYLKPLVQPLSLAIAGTALASATAVLLFLRLLNYVYARR